MIIPAGDSGYLARLVTPLKIFDVNVRPYIKEKQHAGHKKLFGAEVLTVDDDAPIFCVEGYIDAMSIGLAGFKSVALGGRGEGYLLVDAVDALQTPRRTFGD